MKKTCGKLMKHPAFAVLALSMALSACQQLPTLQTTSDQGSPETASASAAPTAVNQPPASLRQFTDIPVPVNANLDKSATMVFGSGDQWIGRLVFSTGTDAFDLFQQYRNRFPQLGWEEITSLRSKVSIITYTRADRVATIQIEPSTLYGSRVEISMSPRDRGTSQPAAPASGNTASGNRASGGVTGAPLTGSTPGRVPYSPVR